MQYAIRSGSPKEFDVDSYFKDNDVVDWRKSGTKQQVGDIIYIYVSDPIRRIKYKTEVVEVDLPFEDTIDDEDYWVKPSDYEKNKNKHYHRLRLIGQGDTEELSRENLIDKGFLKEAPQRKKIIYDDKKPHEYDYEFVQYVDNFLTDVYLGQSEDDFGEVINESEFPNLPEGAVKTKTVRSYERNPRARRLCIQHHGTKCSICGFAFEEMYGDLGKGFIEVHHIVPLSQIRENYRVDPINDLIPVCPNCHEMLHRKLNDKEVSIDELKEIIESHRN